MSQIQSLESGFRAHPASNDPAVDDIRRPPIRHPGIRPGIGSGDDYETAHNDSDRPFDPSGALKPGWVSISRIPVEGPNGMSFVHLDAGFIREGETPPEGWQIDRSPGMTICRAPEREPERQAVLRPRFGSGRIVDLVRRLRLRDGSGRLEGSRTLLERLRVGLSRWRSIPGNVVGGRGNGIIHVERTPIESSSSSSQSSSSESPFLESNDSLGFRSWAEWVRSRGRGPE